MTFEQCIAEMGMTVDEFASAISVPTATIASLINGGNVPSPTIMLVRQTLAAEGLYWNGK